MILYEYQIELVRKISDAHKKHRGVIAVLPTGAGKTVCFARISEILERKTKILIVVHRDELVAQTCQKLSMYGIEHGVIAPGVPYSNNHKVYVGMVRTICNRQIDIEFGYIIFDEAHLAAANSYNKIIERWSNAYRLGLTATPIRLDGKPLTNIASTIVQGPSVKKLIELGKLVPFTTYKVDIADLSGLRKRNGEYCESQQQTIMQRPDVVGNVIEHYKKFGIGRQSLIFASGIKHSLAITKSLNSIGVKAVHIDGKTHPTIRKKAIEELNSGTINAISNYGCLTEGFDCPPVSLVSIPRKTSSFALFRQMFGRGLRTCEGKKNLIVLDHGGNVLEHGDMCYEFEFSIEGIVKKPGENKQLHRICKICCAVAEMNEDYCPVCFEFFATQSENNQKIKEKDGTLIENDDNASPPIAPKTHQQILTDVSWLLQKVRERNGQQPTS